MRETPDAPPPRPDAGVIVDASRPDTGTDSGGGTDAAAEAGDAAGGG
jgi:hypothetical protein